jgi:hypothetical protein
MSPAVGQLVAIDAGNDRMPQSKLQNGLPYMPGLLRVKRRWLAFADRAKAAMPSANVT